MCVQYMLSCFYACFYFHSYTAYAILTVRDTLILDLQVLVCSRAGVWEDINPCDNHTLSPVVTPEGQMDR